MRCAQRQNHTGAASGWHSIILVRHPSRAIARFGGLAMCLFLVFPQSENACPAHPLIYSAGHSINYF